MKIKFLKEHTDGFGKTYQPGWVAEWSQPDAERAIKEGFAQLARENDPVSKSTKPADTKPVLTEKK